MNRLLHRGVIYLLFVNFAGCAPASLLSKSAAPPPLEQNIARCHQDIISLIQKRSLCLQSIKAAARIEIKFKDGRELAGRGVIIVKRPDLFRLEILGPLSQTAAVMIYNRAGLSLFAFQENRLYKDYLPQIYASRLPQYLLGLPSSRNNVQEREIGPESESSPPSSPHNLCSYINSEGENIVADNEGRIKYIFFIPSEIAARDSGYRVRVSLDLYEEIDGFVSPSAISINDDAANISIRYDHIELNQHIPDNLFNLPQLSGRDGILPAPLK